MYLNVAPKISSTENLFSSHVHVTSDLIKYENKFSNIGAQYVHMGIETNGWHDRVQSTSCKFAALYMKKILVLRLNIDLQSRPFKKQDIYSYD
jgi:hypothetical protein